MPPHVAILAAFVLEAKPIAQSAPNYPAINILYIYIFVHIIYIWPCHKDVYAEPLPLRSSHSYIKDGECAESNKISYHRFFPFLVFELLAAKELPIQPRNKCFVQN